MRCDMDKEKAMFFVLMRLHSMIGIMCKPDFEKCLALVEEHNITATELIVEWRKVVSKI